MLVGSVRFHEQVVFPVMHIRHYILSLLLLIVVCLPGRAQVSDNFRAPEDFDSRPWCFWYWMHGAVTKAGITADLEAMAANGLGGCYLMPIKSIEQAPALNGTVRQLSPEWYEMVDYSMQEADRLGLKLGMHICDGFALAGGPWITPEESMQKVVMTDIADTTGTTIGFYSIPASYMKGENPFEGYQPSTRQDSANLVKVTGEGEDLKIDTIAGGFSAKRPCTINYTFETPITASALELKVPANNIQGHRLKVYTSDNGFDYQLVKQLEPARAGWQNYDYNTTHSIPTTTSRYWRFTWDPAGSEPGAEDLNDAKWTPSLKVRCIYFHAAPRVHQWEGKAGLVWRVSGLEQSSLEAHDYIPLKYVRVYASRNSINRKDYNNFYFRLASVSTGATNATGGDGKGLECDKFNREAVRKQLDRWFNSHFYAPVPGRDSLEHLDLARRVLKYMHVDSWECGSQNWSSCFADEFQKRRGYSLMSYMPLMVGFPLADAATTESVLRDVRLTINDLVSDVFYDEVRRNALLMDCSLSAECVCPTMVSDGLSHYRYADLPMGEFWLNSPTHDKMNDMLDAVSGGHIYGKRIIQAEGFTELRGTFEETPAMLKPLLDRNFCLGINRLFYHVWCLTPQPLQRPGMTLDGIGLFFQRGNTWFRESSALTAYITRCQYLLQLGRPVVDIAVYTGQEMPRRSFTPDRLMDFLPGLFDAHALEAEKQRLLNEGQPIQEKPVGVKYQRNTFVAENWVNPLNGYHYDSFNEDALMRCRVRLGHITMQSLDEAAPSYSVLIIPGKHKMDPDSVAMPESVLSRIEDLRRMGANIVTQDQLPWTGRTLGSLDIPRDVDNLPDGIAWCHRSSDDAEIYFLSNQLDSLVALRPSFRDSRNRQGELWDPMTGDIRPMGHEVVLPPYGSTFVIFPVTPTPTDSLLPPLVNDGRGKYLTSLRDKEWRVYFHDINTTDQFGSLLDWSLSPRDDIRYYSGRATYSTSFDTRTLMADSSALQMKGADGRIYLRLNRVGDVATVRINDKPCGVAWSQPYEVDVTDALVEGVNRLEIDVTNTWVNALRGIEEGHNSQQHIWTNARYRRASKDLLPGGLLGPIDFILK